MKLSVNNVCEKLILQQYHNIRNDGNIPQKPQKVFRNLIVQCGSLRPSKHITRQGSTQLKHF